MENLTLIVFLFCSSEQETPMFHVPVVIDGGDNPVDVDYLIDGVTSFFESDYHADTDEEALSIVLDCSGYAWHFLADGDPVPQCNGGLRMISV